jgi:hypothetical protein
VVECKAKFKPQYHQKERGKKKKSDPGGSCVILATQEAEIRRIAAQSQPGPIVNEILS